jgi:hypothetical protein
MAVVAARAGLATHAIALAKIDGQHGVERPEREVLLAHFVNDAASLESLAEEVFAQVESGHQAISQPKAMLLLGKVAEGLCKAPPTRVENLIRLIEARCAGKRDSALRAQLTLYKGQFALINENPVKAERAFKAACSLARASGSGRLLCSGLERTAAVALQRGRFRHATQAGEECLALSSALGLRHLEALAYERLIECRMRRADWDQAYKLAELYLRRCSEGLADPSRARGLLRTLESA